MIPVDMYTMRNMIQPYKGAAGVAQGRILTQTGPLLVKVLPGFGITTRLRIAHFLAQCAHESDGFRTLEEYATGVEYDGRRDLGNVVKGDGMRYKGRSFIQLTGRANYRRVGQALGLSLEENPLIALVPENALAISCEFWKEHNLNKWADNDDIIQVTQIVNGGQNGIESRKTYLAAAKREVIRAEVTLISPGVIAMAPHIVLHRGMIGAEVGDLQDILRRGGYKIATDQNFGPGTEAVVMNMQRDHDLTADGIVGPETWEELEKIAYTQPA